MMLTRRSGRGLRHGPELAVGTAVGATGDVDGEVGQRAPEVVQRNAAIGVALVVDVDRAVDGDVARVLAQAGDLGVEADLEDQRAGLGAVDARLEEDRVARRAHLVADLLGGDRVDLGLDVRLGHRGVEHDDVGAEVRVARAEGVERRGVRGRGAGETAGGGQRREQCCPADDDPPGGAGGAWSSGSGEGSDRRTRAGASILPSEVFWADVGRWRSRRRGFGSVSDAGRYASPGDPSRPDLADS